MPESSPMAAEGVLEEVRGELQALAEKAALACRAGHEWLVVVTAVDLGRCIWVAEKAPRLSDNPIENIRLRCREYQTVLEFGVRAFPEKWSAVGIERFGPLRSSLEERTQMLYGTLWVEFDDEAYFGEATSLLSARLERNRLGQVLAGKRCLDAGCGGGRYAVALRRLGAAGVVGLDFGVRGIRDGHERVARAGVDGVTFCIGSVLELPFDDASFDFVMSNGVLHHTSDPFKGLQEMRRVMKPGEGTGWLYLYNSDGLHWTVRKTLRQMVNGIPEEFTKQVLISLGVSPNRLFAIMDSLYVPIEENYTREEVEQMLARAGFRRWRLLRRGADRDLSEAVYRGDPYAVEMYGEYGDLRFWLEG